MSRGLIYLDYNASAPLRPEVVQDMLVIMRECPGNPSSIHSRGRRLRELLEEARDKLADLLGISSAELVFTGGGSAADNLAIKGVASGKKGHIITSAIEHPAVLEPCRYLGQTGFDLSIVSSNEKGIVQPETIAENLRADTFLVAVMYANNEVGTIQPINRIAQVLEGKNIIFHVDAIQALGKCNLDLSRVDTAALSAHKIGGPQGVGALFVREGIRIESLIHGGGHESGLRAGTENVAGIIGFVRAAELAVNELETNMKKVGELRDLLEERIMASLSGVKRHGDLENRLPNTSNLSFAQASGEAIVMGLNARNIAVSTGSACSSGLLEPSHVLIAMGCSPQEGKESVRFSLGPENNREDILSVSQAVVEVVGGFRNLSS